MQTVKPAEGKPQNKNCKTAKSKLQNCRMYTVYLRSCRVGQHVADQKQKSNVPILASIVTEKTETVQH